MDGLVEDGLVDDRRISARLGQPEPGLSLERDAVVAHHQPDRLDLGVRQRHVTGEPENPAQSTTPVVRRLAVGAGRAVIREQLARPTGRYAAQGFS
jgi:hypothetical protein